MFQPKTIISWVLHHNLHGILKIGNLYETLAELFPSLAGFFSVVLTREEQSKISESISVEGMQACHRELGAVGCLPTRGTVAFF